MKKIIQVALLSLLTAFFFEVEASHFRYGTINYAILSESGSGAAKQTVVQFTIRQAWRGDAFGAFPSVGTVYAAGSYGDFYMNYGDGGGDYFAFTVTSVNAGENWFAGIGTLTHTYTGNVDVIANYDNCCRIGALVNNSSGSMRNESVVTLSQTNNASPLSSIPPIVNVPDNAALHTFNLNFSDPNGDAMSYSVSTTAQSDLTTTTPSFFTSLNPATGLVSLNTTGAGIVDGQLYAIQFAATDSKGARTVLDFIMKITSASPNTAPVFVAPTPANNSTINATVGVPMSFTVKASDADAGDLVSLSASGVPVGATFSPGPAANPVMTAFSWTPTPGDVGSHSIAFSATDNNAGQVISNVNINVAAGGGCAFTNTLQPVMTASLYAAAGANQANMYYWGLSTGFVKANPTGGVGPYTYSWSNSAGYAMKGVTNKKGRLYYPTGPTWMYVEITDQGAGCTIKDSIWIDWTDVFTCNPQGQLWFYVLCNSVNNTTVCVPKTRNMRDSLKTGNYYFGTCLVPKMSNTESVTMNVSVFPNPNSGTFTYIITNEKETTYNIAVMDLNGRTLHAEKVESKDKYSSNEIQLSGLAAGIYLLQISSEDQSIVERIIIQ